MRHCGCLVSRTAGDRRPLFIQRKSPAFACGGAAGYSVRPRGRLSGELNAANRHMFVVCLFKALLSSPIFSYRLLCSDLRDGPVDVGFEPREHGAPDHLVERVHVVAQRRFVSGERLGPRPRVTRVPGLLVAAVIADVEEGQFGVVDVASKIVVEEAHRGVERLLQADKSQSGDAARGLLGRCIVKRLPLAYAGRDVRILLGDAGAVHVLRPRRAGAPREHLHVAAVDARQRHKVERRRSLRRKNAPVDELRTAAHLATPDVPAEVKRGEGALRGCAEERENRRVIDCFRQRLVDGPPVQRALEVDVRTAGRVEAVVRRARGLRDLRERVRVHQQFRAVGDTEDRPQVARHMRAEGKVRPPRRRAAVAVERRRGRRAALWEVEPPQSPLVVGRRRHAGRRRGPPRAERGLGASFQLGEEHSQRFAVARGQRRRHRLAVRVELQPRRKKGAGRRRVGLQAAARRMRRRLRTRLSFTRRRCGRRQHERGKKDDRMPPRANHRGRAVRGRRVSGYT
mmetsp:Transcript_17107/g.60845  ORF Transcript_17107/g.60845 Transcript_17107/m.60845 type:complete len:513 (-) Transcript_17107:50-1588(-)